MIKLTEDITVILKVEIGWFVLLMKIYFTFKKQSNLQHLFNLV
jgi:hypothetical protein